MKVYLRDRITAGLGVSVLAVLAAMSYYYSIHTETEALRAEIIRESPDFTSTNIALTQFKADGTAERRIFADYAEHYEDGRMTSLRPRLVTLSVDKPQVKASADTGISSDAGETVHFTGNVIVTRAGDRENAPMRFETEQLTVFPDTEIFETGAPVKLVNGGDSLYLDKHARIDGGFHLVKYLRTDKHFNRNGIRKIRYIKGEDELAASQLPVLAGQHLAS